MDDQRTILRETMRATGTTQSALARMSGVRQPSISQFLSGTIEMSDAQLDRLLACMGRRLEVTRCVVEPRLHPSEERVWRLHRELAARLNATTLAEWRPKIERNVERRRRGVQGAPHEQNVERWVRLVQQGDLSGMRRILTGLDRDSIEMREVAPFVAILPEDVRIAAINRAV